MMASRMWRSVRGLILASVACSSPPAKPDAYCGTGSASPNGLVATAGATTFTFTNLSASPNADCQIPTAPKGVIAMTIAPPPLATPLLTVCIPRPDLLPGGLPIGSQAQLVDLDGTSDGCSFTLDDSIPPSGTMSAAGLCDAGSAHAGFALSVDATATLSRMCGSTVDQVSATLSGTIAVAGP